MKWDTAAKNVQRITYHQLTTFFLFLNIIRLFTSKTVHLTSYIP